MKILFAFTFLFFSTCCGYAQTCVLRIDSADFLESNLQEEINTFLSLEFSINGIPLKATDSIEKIIPLNRNGFDSIRYSYTWNNQQVEKFSLCKFKPDETYKISPCTCCGIFLIVPKSKAERGFVKFVNRSKQLYLGSASEFDFDSIPPKSGTDFLFSAISMNCGFRPSQITVAVPEYLHSQLSGAKELKVKRMMMRGDVPFLFLHGERLIVTIPKNATQFNLKLE